LSEYEILEAIPYLPAKVLNDIGVELLEGLQDYNDNKDLEIDGIFEEMFDKD
jgi:hypothetical protein